MSEKQSQTKISDEILSLAAMEAAESVTGVNHLAESLAGNLTKFIAGKGDNYKGIKISKDKEDMYVIDVSIVADYGRNIPQLAWDIQSSVKKRIEKTINQKIGAVNIHIQGVSMPKKKGEE